MYGCGENVDLVRFDNGLDLRNRCVKENKPSI